MAVTTQGEPERRMDSLGTPFCATWQSELSWTNNCRQTLEARPCSCAHCFALSFDSCPGLHSIETAMQTREKNEWSPASIDSRAHYLAGACSTAERRFANVLDFSPNDATWLRHGWAFCQQPQHWPSNCYGLSGTIAITSQCNN